MSGHTTWMALALVALVVGVLHALPMSRVVLWSPMSGRVLMNGRPAAGAVLQREWFWHWKDRRARDTAIADADGAFSFPLPAGRSLAGALLPHEPVIEQVMDVQWQGESYRVWSRFSHSYTLNAENAGRPVVVTCRLDAPRAVRGGVNGRCEFDDVDTERAIA